MRPAFWMVAVALVPFLGCKDPARDETRSLVDAVSRFRLAPDGEKHARIPDIQRVTCTALDVCEARETCVDMAEELDHSLALRVQVNAGLMELKNGTMTKEEPRAQALYPILDESKASLEKAHELGKACDNRLSQLMVHHR